MDTYLPLKSNSMAPDEKITGILHTHELKKTPARVKVLHTLMGSKYAVSYTRLEEVTRDVADRITLYRILKHFEQKGLIHKTMDHEGLAKYAMCHDECSTDHHRDHHIHFNCTECHQTLCLEDTDIPKIHLPRGYKASEYAFTINGLCRLCSKG